MMHLIGAGDVKMSSQNVAGHGGLSIDFRCVLLIFLIAVKCSRPETSPATTCLPAPTATQPTTDQSLSLDKHLDLSVTNDICEGPDGTQSILRSDRVDVSRKNLTSFKVAILKTCYMPLDLSQVNLLNLSANHLDILLDRGFEGLASLKCLDLAGNKLRLIQDNAFWELGGLLHLNLSGNYIATLQDETFRGLISLQQLDLSFNYLSTIAPGSLELPTLTRLEIAGNGHLGIGKASLFLATGKRLQTLDATGIGVGHVPSALTHSIRTLHLADNQISSISRGEMDTYPLLQLLDLTGNQLVDVEEDALGRLEMLTILYLTANYLTTIPHSLPEKLKILHLEHNRIDRLRLGDLEGLDQLEVLLLNGNLIKTIGNGAFGQMIALVSLDLSLNPLTELPAGMLAGPLGLRVLRLGQLNVSMPNGGKETAFPLLATEHLITLDVSSSPALARQWLADIAALVAARELQELDLSFCGIQNLPIDLLHYLPQLRLLHLKGNDLNCTELEWLADWMRRQEVNEYREVICQSPGELWGTLLIDLQNLQETIEDKPSTKSYPTTNTNSMSDISRETDNSFLIPSSLLGYHFNKSNQTGNDADANTTIGLNAESESEQENTTPKGIKTTMATSTITLPSAEDQIQTTLRSNVVITKSSARVNTKSSKTLASNLRRPALRKEQIMERTGRTISLQSSTTMASIAEHEATKIKPMSLVTNNFEKLPDQNRPTSWSLHPGMYLLVIGVMAATLILITLSTRISGRPLQMRREDLRGFQVDHGELIEVSSLPSVTELW